MNIRHSSTGKRVIMNLPQNYLENFGKSGSTPRYRIENLDLTELLQSPSNSNSEALNRIKSRIKKNKETLLFPSIVEEKRVGTSRMPNSFMNVFPQRNSKIHRIIASNSIDFEDKESPKKYFHRKADHFSSHREAMIRASDLFKLYAR